MNNSENCNFGTAIMWVGLRGICAGVVAITLFGLGSCTVIDSPNAVYYDDETNFEYSREGLIYYLPKTLVEVSIVPWVAAKNGKAAPGSDVEHITLEVADGAEQNIPDPSAPLVLRYVPDPFYTDRMCAAVSDTGLIQSVEVATDDQTPENPGLSRQIGGTSYWRHAVCASSAPNRRGGRAYQGRGTYSEKIDRPSKHGRYRRTKQTRSGPILAS